MAVFAIVFLTAMIGFYITLDVSPQIAYARLFIDVGLGIGLFAIVLAFYKEKPLPIDGLMHAISSLKNGKYDTRISADNLGQLASFAHSINDLAEKLLEKEEKQEEIKRSLREELLPKFKPKDSIIEQHSIHPELGPVLPILGEEPILNNTLVNSNPPHEVLIESIHPKNRVEQDLGALYEKFISAQKEKNLEEIEYTFFLKTIEKSKKDIISSYNCIDVSFDVVNENDEVALQPRLIR